MSSPWNGEDIFIPSDTDHIKDEVKIVIGFQVHLKKGTCDVFYQKRNLGQIFHNLPLDGDDGEGIVMGVGFIQDKFKQSAGIRFVETCQETH